MNKTQSLHWSDLHELGNNIGLKFMLMVYKCLGKQMAYFCIYFIAAYYYLFNKRARAASECYLAYLQQMGLAQQVSSYKHFVNFGQMIIDKVAAWNHDIALEKIDFPQRVFFEDKIKAGKGGVIFTAHMGNIDIARSLARLIPEFKINSLVFNQHAKRIQKLLHQLNPAVKMNIIELQNISVDLAIHLREKIEQGEFIVIATDRTSTTQPERTITAQFLNKAVYLPEGPFILAGLLKCPTYFMSCIKDSQGLFHIDFQIFQEQIDISKAQRKINLANYAQQNANYWQQLCLQYPLQWFNFFDFWANYSGYNNE